jgi:aconitase B
MSQIKIEVYPLLFATNIDSMALEIYKYLNFDKMDEYVESIQRGQEIAIKLIA